jgi:hypothetical protein
MMTEQYKSLRFMTDIKTVMMDSRFLTMILLVFAINFNK